MTSVPIDAQPAPDGYRMQQLANAVQLEVSRGARVESQGPFNAVLRRGKGTNHVLHLILSVLTFGLWLFVWGLLAIINKSGQGTTMLSVDMFGNVLRQ